MEQTSRLSIVIDTGNAETTIRRLERSLSDLQRQGTNTANSLANLGRQSSLNGLLSGVARASGGMANLGSSVSRTAGIFSNYYNSLNRTTNNFNQFNNAINRTTNNITRMGDTINRNITVINNYNRSLSGTHDALSRLQGLLTGGMFGVFALSVAKTADSMQETHSQIKLVTKSHEEYLVVADRLHEMAGKNLKDFQATAGLYTNSARALGQLGKSQEEVLKFTNAVSLAMSVGGKSAQEQASALLQLGQAMQAGALQGDEFRAVAENSPILLDLIAEKLGKTRAEIKELGSDGKITSEVIHDALADATPKLQEMFDKMPVTMSQGFSVLKNEYRKFTHELMNGEGGISSVVAKGLVDVSRNFENFATILMGAAATWGILKVAQSSFVTTTIPALIAGTAGSISTFYAQGVAMLTTATSTSALSRALTMATLRGASFAVSVTVGTREILRKAVAVGTATRTFLAHSASVLRSSMSIAGLRANIGLLTRSVLTNTGAFLRGTVAVQAKTLAMGALGVVSRATAGTVGVLAGSIKSLGAIINAHPIMFLSTVIFGVVASTEGLQGAMDSLSDTVKVVGSIFGEFITTTGHGLKNGIGSAIDWVADLLGKKSKDGTSVANKAFNDLFGNTEKGFLGILQVIARVFDIAAAGFWGFVDYGSKQFDNMVIKAKNAWSSLQSFFGFGDGYQIPTIEVSFSDAFKKALANQKANGMESLLLSHNGRVQANKSLDLSAVDLTVPSQAQTSSSSDKDKKGKKGKINENLNTQEGRMMMVFRAFKNAGFSDEQARQLTAQVGRENEYQIKYLFGTHSDNNNNKTNIGMISWQGDRAKKLWREMEQAGFIKNGKMVQSQEALDFQARYLAREMMENPSYARTRRDFLGTDNPSYEKGMAALDQNFIKWDWRGKKIDAPSHYKRQRGHYANITNQTKDLRDYQQEAKEQQTILEQTVKQQQEIRSLFLSNKEIQAKEYFETVDKINEAFAGDDKKRIEYLGKLRILFNKTQDYQDALSAYELTSYRMSQKQRLQMEKQLALQKLEISTELDEQQKQHHRQAIVDKYNFDNEQFQKSQQENIAHFDSMIKSTLKMGYTATLTDMLNKRFLSKFDYEQWQLDQNIATQKADETKRYEGLISSINQQDNTGNFVIDDAIERHRLLQEAEQSHLQEMTALRRIYAEQTRVLEQESLEHTLTAYGSVFSSLSGLVKNYSSEQSSAYRTMFAISKSFALAQAGIAVWSSASDAYAKEPGTVWQKMAAALKATIDQGKFVNLISAVSPRGFKTGGYTGNVGTSQIAGVVHGQEYVVNAKATKRIGVDNLNKLNSGGSLGGVNIVINNYTSEKASVEQMPNGDFMVTIGKMVKEMSRAEARQVMYEESRQGGMLDRHYRR